VKGPLPFACDLDRNAEINVIATQRRNTEGRSAPPCLSRTPVFEPSIDIVVCCDQQIVKV